MLLDIVEHDRAIDRDRSNDPSDDDRYDGQRSQKPWPEPPRYCAEEGGAIARCVKAELSSHE
jgi:hypothetical protein